MDGKSFAMSAIARAFMLPPSPELPTGWTVELPGRGTTFAAEIPGPEDAPTLFLLHGLACTSYLNWFPALPALAGRYRIVMMDLRGHGRGIPSGRFLRLSDCADDVVALADALGIERFIPVGYSMGGPVAQLVWRQHRERVEGLVLCATARNFRGHPAERLFFLMLPLVVLGVAAGRPPGRTAETLLRALTEEDGDENGDGGGSSGGLVHVPEWAWAEFRSTRPWSMVQAVNAVGQFSSHRWVSDIDVPTAVVVTTKDRFIPTRRQLRLAEAIPGATVHEFPGNHAACVLGHRRFVPALVDAIESVVDRLP